MKTSLKKLTSVVLAVLMLVSVFAVSASAADSSAKPTGGYTVVLDASGAGVDAVEWKAWTWADGGSGRWAEAHGTNNSDITFDSLEKNIIFAYFTWGTGTPNEQWGGKIAQSKDMTVQGATFTVTNANGTVEGTWSGDLNEGGGSGNDPTNYSQPDTGSSSGSGYTVVLDASGAGVDAVEWKAWTWADGGSGRWAEAHGTNNSDITFDSLEKNIIFAYFTWGTGTPNEQWGGKIAQSEDMTVQGATFTVTNANGTVAGTWSGDPVMNGSTPTSNTDPTGDTGYTDPSQPSSGGGSNVTAKFVVLVYCEEYSTDPAERTKEFEMTNGTFSYEFPGASYVFVRNYDTGVQYCTDGWSNFANPVTLVNQNALSDQANFDKMYVPAGQHTLTLTDNGNDTYSLAYDGGSQSDPTDPSTPSDPTDPSNPSSDSTPSNPSSDSTPSNPSSDSTPSNPSSDSTPSNPSSDSTPSNPSGDGLTASVKLNGTEVKSIDVTGTTLTVTYNLTAPALITDGDLALNYDSSKLTLASVDLPNITTGKTTSPKLTANPYYVNFTGVNNSTHSGIYDFKSNKVLLKAVFNVASGAKGTAIVNLVIQELDGLESDVSTSYFTDSAATTAGTALVSSLSNVAVEQSGGSNPSNPSSDSTPSNPSSDSTPSNPSSDSTPSNPSSDSTPSNPSSDSTPSNPSSDSTPTNPSSDSNPTSPTSAPKTTVKASAVKSKIYVGATTDIATIINNEKGKTTFVSSNKKVATVSSKGKVKGVKAGSVTIKVTNNKAYAKVKITVVKRNNPMTVKAKTITVKPKAKKTVFKKTKAFTIKNAKGTVTFKKVKGSKYVSINKKSGKITVKKGLKKGKTYKVKFKVSAKGTTAYKAKSKTVTVKVKVKKK